MPYVNVPNDLSKIKTKIAFNLTKRQLICFGIGAAIGVPAYLLTRQAIGNTGALFAMLAIMLPAFLLAMYEKDGLPFEKVIRNIVRVKFTRPGIRPYEGTIYQYNYDNVISCVCIASCCAGVFIYLHLGTICPKVASPGCRSPPFLRFVHPPTHELNGGNTNDDHQSEGLLRLVHP